MDITITPAPSLLDDAKEVAKEMLKSGKEIDTIPLGAKKVFISTNRDLIYSTMSFFLEGTYFYVGFEKE